MKKLFQFSYLFIFLFVLKTLPCFSQQNLSLSLDVCQYRFNQDSSLVEIYYSLLTKDDSTSEKASYVLELRITEKENVIISNLWKVQQQTLDSEGEKQSRMIVDVLRYLFAPGNYNIKLIAKNLLSPNLVDSIGIADFSVGTFRNDKIEMSDIEIAQKIIPANPTNKTKFDKNRFNVIPNTLKIFAKENPDVYYYFESYNLKGNVTRKYFEIKRTVLDMYGLPVASIPAYLKKKRVRGNDDVEVGMFNVLQLPSGKFYLNFAILDSNANEIASTNTVFFVHNPAVVPIDRNNLPIENQMASSEIALLPQDDLDVMINATKYLIEDDELKVINNLENENAKRIFLYRFWKERDNNNTPALETYREMLKRVQFATANFTSIKRAGWQTDRGRVLIKYGKPSEIQYYPNVADFKEFQAWSYDQIENGVVFIFGVTGGFGDLQLIHSTKTSELHNSFWFDLIKVSEGRSGFQEMAPGIADREAIRDVFRRHNLELPRYLK